MKKQSVSKSRFLSAAAVIAIILSLSYGCSKSTMANMTGTGGTGSKGDTSFPGPNEVWIQNMAFFPNSITVAAGTTITFTNKDAITHTVTSNTKLFDSGDLFTSGTFAFTFATAGSYPYFCAIHPGMTGIVIVN